jgi:hypothetical protein
MLLNESEWALAVDTLKIRKSTLEPLAKSLGIPFNELVLDEPFPVNLFGNHTKLTEHVRFLSTSVAAAASGTVAPVPEPLTAPRQNVTAPTQTPGASTDYTKINYAEAVRQHIAAHGNPPLKIMPGSGFFETESSPQASRPLRDEQTRAASTETAAPPPVAPAARVQMTYAEKCGAVNQSKIKPSRQAKITPAQAAKMTLTQLCQAAKTNAETPPETYERYEAYSKSIA